MTGHGFIDPQAPLRRRVEKLEALISLVLPTLDESVLSEEAQELLAEVRRGDRRRLHRLLAEDPLDSEDAVWRGSERGRG